MGIHIALAFALAFTGFATACSDDDPKAVDAAVDPSIDAAMHCGMSTKGYLEVCADSSECGTCTCENFGHTMNCTKPCMSDDECPAPSRGCTTNGTPGVCRL